VTPDREEKSVDTLTIRPRWYCWPCLFGLAMIALCIVLGFFNHGFFGVAPILIFLFVYAVAGTKIAVTPTELIVRVWPLYRSSRRRDEITAMHWYGQYFAFTAEDHRVLLKISSLGWKGSQLVELSEAPGVPLFSYRTKWGLGRDATIGRRLRPASTRSPSRS
jgi:hypothetical protein